jgi:hypothetical protein
MFSGVAMRLTLLAIAAMLLGGSSAQADCAGDFAAIMKHGKQAGPFRVEEESSVGKQHLTTMTEQVPPHAVRVRVTTPDGEQEVIIIDTQAWGKVKGLWLPLDEKTSRQMQDGLAGAGLFYSDGATNIQCLGEKAVDGVSYLAFKYDALISNFTVPMTVYVDPSTRLPVKTEGTMDSGGDTAHFSATYKPDPSVTISPPPKP